MAVDNSSASWRDVRGCMDDDGWRGRENCNNL